MKAPSDLSSKLVDWEALAAVGGESLIAGKSVLDLGPCYGVDAFLFARLARRYVVVDNDDHVLAWIRERVPEAETFACDMAAMPFEGWSFDLVLDFSSIDNCCSPNPLDPYREAFRVLRPGGTLITTFANAFLLPSRPNEVASDPHALCTYLKSLGATVRYTANWHESRAVIAMVKQ